MTTGKIVEKINDRVNYLFKRGTDKGEVHGDEIIALGRAKKALEDFFEGDYGITIDNKKLLKAVYDGYLKNDSAGVRKMIEGQYANRVFFNAVSIFGIMFIEEVQDGCKHVYFAGIEDTINEFVLKGLRGEYNHDSMEEVRFYHKSVERAFLMTVKK